jgi:hypothetical protein
LDEVKNAHRGLDGTYRSAAEMERHRAQLADAAIEEQLEVQTAFREQGARLQGVYDKKQRGEFEMAKRYVMKRGKFVHSSRVCSIIWGLKHGEKLCLTSKKKIHYLFTKRFNYPVVTPANKSQLIIPFQR